MENQGILSLQQLCQNVIVNRVISQSKCPPQSRVFRDLKTTYETWQIRTDVSELIRDEILYPMMNCGPVIRGKFKQMLSEVIANVEIDTYIIHALLFFEIDEIQEIARYLPKIPPSNKSIFNKTYRLPQLYSLLIAIRLMEDARIQYCCRHIDSSIPPGFRDKKIMYQELVKKALFDITTIYTQIGAGPWYFITNKGQMFSRIKIDNDMLKKYVNISSSKSAKVYSKNINADIAGYINQLYKDHDFPVIFGTSRGLTDPIL